VSPPPGTPDTNDGDAQSSDGRPSDGPPDEPPDGVDPDTAVARTRETYERIAPAYRERNASVEPVESLLERFREALPSPEASSSDGPRVLDAGCGHGRDAAWLAARGCRVVGLDVAAAQLANARTRAPAAALVRGDLRRLPLADGTFDGALAMASLLHLPRESLPGALADLRRVLRPGGVLGVSVRRRLGGGDEDGGGADGRDGNGTPTEGFGREGRYFVAHGPDALREYLADAGFAVETVDPDGDWVWALARRPA
jgi:SAM-dependent methyltransferase